MARRYACERQAFGRAIGSFQAIKHRLADLYVTLEIARSNAYHGAYALSSDAADLPVAAAAAHLAAGKAFTGCATENIQVHGGSGFTWEGDCQLFYRRARWLSLALGGERRWKQRLVASLRAAREDRTRLAGAAIGL
jgi:acyl-CoA dehydrogenase